MTCPAGVVVALTVKGRASFGANCRTCPLRRRCTTAKAGRVIVLHPHHSAPRRRPPGAQSKTEAFDGLYRRWRPMVERVLAWLPGK